MCGLVVFLVKENIKTYIYRHMNDFASIKRSSTLQELFKAASGTLDFKTHILRYLFLQKKQEEFDNRCK